MARKVEVKAERKVLVYTLKYVVEPQFSNLDEVLEKMNEYGHGTLLDVTTDVTIIALGDYELEQDRTFADAPWEDQW